MGGRRGRAAARRRLLCAVSHLARGASPSCSTAGVGARHAELPQSPLREFAPWTWRSGQCRRGGQPTSSSAARPAGAFGTGRRRPVFDGGGVAPVVVADRGCPPVRSRRLARGQARGMGLLRGGLRCWASGGWGGASGDGVAVTADAVGSANPSSLVGGLRGRRRRYCHGGCWARRRSVRRFSFRASARGRGCSSRSAGLSCVWGRGDGGASGNAGLLGGKRRCGENGRARVGGGGGAAGSDTIGRCVCRSCLALSLRVSIVTVQYKQVCPNE